ncbi:alpha/beta hydrolase [Jatrophihabitans telluris]|uniref:Alpha/beta hydrolase n=1 Tax=Jatrophihabitans telluris TaxID=2038343 RepID=A0ABY4R640_9ACTN|nr:alpha/beta hydrolase [Jatrophihabitans telluris]UQX90240.1 alpha/beta hydrolase [Jatrophihabitans telluris]
MPDRPTSSAGQTPTVPPRWFTEAIAKAAEVCSIEVDGVPINYRAWGRPAAEGVLLIHGGAAHARWWDHIAPLLTSGRRVLAVDLSGHGDSGRRDSYSLPAWADEAMAVARAGGISAAPVIVGHSMGGFVALTAARLYGSAIEGVMTIDSPVRELTPEEQAARRGVFRRLKVHPSKAEVIARWRPVPEQDVVLPYIAAHIAEHSVRPLEDGWSWKFDPAIFTRGSGMSPGLLTRLECRVAVFRSEYGLLSSAMTDVMYDRLGRLAATIEFPAAGHAVMLDQPLALVTAIRTLLADWEHSVSLSEAGPAPADSAGR